MIGFIIYVLAVYGVSTLISDYDGPNNIFYRLRSKYSKSALTCTVCLSVWVALILFIPILLGIGYLVLSPLAVIGGVILLERLT